MLYIYIYFIHISKSSLLSIFHLWNIQKIERMFVSQHKVSNSNSKKVLTKNIYLQFDYKNKLLHKYLFF